MGGGDAVSIESVRKIGRLLRTDCACNVQAGPACVRAVTVGMLQNHLPPDMFGAWSVTQRVLTPTNTQLPYSCLVAAGCVATFADMSQRPQQLMRPVLVINIVSHCWQP